MTKFHYSNVGFDTLHNNVSPLCVDKDMHTHILSAGLLSSPSVMLYLGGQVPVEDAHAVQVLEASGDVQRQTPPHAPGQEHIAVQQLLQTAPIDVLKERGIHIYEY